LAAAQVKWNYLTGSIAAERDVTSPFRLGHEDRHPGDEPFERTAHRLHPDGHGWMLPEQNVMLEVHVHGTDLDV
jgi:hypothetical protein